MCSAASHDDPTSLIHNQLESFFLVLDLWHTEPIIIKNWSIDPMEGLLIFNSKKDYFSIRPDRSNWKANARCSAHDTIRKFI